MKGVPRMGAVTVIPSATDRLVTASTPKGDTFNAGRNAAKRRNWRNSVIDRCARRRKDSWARETRNRALGRPYGYPESQP